MTRTIYDLKTRQITQAPDLPPGPAEPLPSSKQLNFIKFRQRASVQADLLAYMAADNVERVEAGIWKKEDLLALLEDPALIMAQKAIATLSYELAIQAISAATTPLLTEEIKADWIGELTKHLYNPTRKFK